MKKWILTLLIAMTSVSQAKSGASYGGFTFSEDVPAEQVKVLKEDIDALYALPAMKDSVNLMKYSGMTALSGPDFHNWILNRIKFFVPEMASLDLLFGGSNENYEYSKSGTNRMEDGDVLLAGNIGGALYLISKQNKKLGTATINNRTMPVLSPRIGIVQIYDSYFTQEYQKSLATSPLINQLSRLSTLFHEARHSDGHGANTGFTHALCPKGHIFEGERACDSVENGSYGLEARFDRVLSKNCANCKAPEIEALRMMALDNYSRLIQNTATTSKVVKLQQEMSTYRYILKLCRTSDVKDADCTGDRLKQLQQKYIDLRAQVDYLVRTKESEKPVRTVIDGTPEGFYEDLSVEQTKASMLPQL